ncbi:MAG: hypothetical protein U9R29_05645 [Thermodesulfobacteriota bacterium]|nr:hypothetical protein [Thermodesulfobacteriota bacterium]
MAVSSVVESIFNTILEQLSDEVGALLGTPIELADHRLEILTKDQLFEVSRGRSVLSTMVVSGDNDGEAFIITELKDSVILGGTLIMLPKEQIEENCKQRTFEGEAADAYGEVANIIAGVYTAAFQDLHPDNFHFKRTSVTDFVPTQIDPKSDTPFPPGEYVYSCCSIKLEGFDLHNLEVIIPANILGEESTTETKSNSADHAEESPSTSQQEASEPEEEQPEEEQPEEEQPEEEEPEEEQPEEERIQQETVDRTLKAALTQCIEEAGGMIGLEIELEGMTTRYTNKKEFFAKPGKKTIATEMLVSGDSKGTAYFLTDLKDAIFFAGTMIMLPADEINKHIKSGDFGEDEQDAFGEVANIISGGLVQNFDELYPRKFHLKKGKQELFVPTKVKIDDPTPFPPDEYYIISGTMSCDARDLGEVSFICPVDLLHMVPRPAETGWGTPAPSEDTPELDTDTTPNKDTPAPSTKTTPKQQSPSPDTPSEEKQQPLPPAVVVVSDDPSLSTHFTESLNTIDHKIIELKTSENFTSLRKHSILGAFLLMSEVNEQGFATIIKVRSEISQDCPLIVAGSQWTRSDVIKAVRYGATDIILTPATQKEICEKAATNLKTACH